MGTRHIYTRWDVAQIAMQKETEKTVMEVGKYLQIIAEHGETVRDQGADLSAK